MDIALMNEKVVFQKCSVVADRIGNRRNEWTDEYCCFATIGGEGLASSREAETAGTVVEDVGMTVTVRYCKKTAGIRSVTHRGGTVKCIVRSGYRCDPGIFPLGSKSNPRTVR